MSGPPPTGKKQDNYSLAAQALIRGAILKEQHFTAIYAARDRARRAATGEDPFRVNPKSIKPVAAAIGAADKRHLTDAMHAREAANKAALLDTLRASMRPPQARTRLPATAAQEVGWNWAAAPGITRAPLVPAFHAMSEIVRPAPAAPATATLRDPNAPTPHSTRAPRDPLTA